MDVLVDVAISIIMVRSTVCRVRPARRMVCARWDLPSSVLEAFCTVELGLEQVAMLALAGPG